MKTASRFESLTPYKPNETVEQLARRLNCDPEFILKLDANENPYGPSPKTLQALRDFNNPNLYPDPASRNLLTGLAGYTGVPKEFLLAGSGADELIDLLLRVMLEPGDGIMTFPPTFEMYAVNTLLNNGQVHTVPRRPDFSIDLESALAACREKKPKVVFLTHPNNPDGKLAERKEIEEFLKLDTLVVVDEAYIEFTGEDQSWIKEVPRRENLVVLRTFSKWAGLAGLRIGYGAFPLWLVEGLWKAKPPFNVNAAAQYAALSSLADLGWLRGNIEKIKRERTRLTDALRQISYLEVYPSEANFILCKVVGREAAEVQTKLLEKGILVRRFAGEVLPNHLRITVGTPDDTYRLVRALADQMEEGREKIRLQDCWVAPEKPAAPGRLGEVERKTNETDIRIKLNLDGSGKHHIKTGLGFFDHMLAQIAVHGLFDLDISARGDLQVDAHHTVEDTALALGEAFAKALGDRKGIVRMGSVQVPMDESLAEVVLDLSGRPYVVFDIDWHQATTGDLPNQLWIHFFQSFSQRSGCNLHITLKRGLDDHHQIEAAFKGLARALSAATRIDPRRAGQSPSSKGTITI
ncbi:MAG: histidinol-phosphate transaminase [Anaerolineaceae bacterium]